MDGSVVQYGFLTDLYRTRLRHIGLQTIHYLYNEPNIILLILCINDKKCKDYDHKMC
jgi:hypothetical protein